jgi:hypothetical protein
VLERLPELAECVHALVHGLTTEHFDAQFQPSLVKLFIIHDFLPPLSRA